MADSPEYPVRRKNRYPLDSCHRHTGAGRLGICVGHYWHPEPELADLYREFSSGNEYGTAVSLGDSSCAEPKVRGGSVSCCKEQVFAGVKVL